MRPLARSEIIRVFGDPHAYLGPDGLPGAAWESKILAWGNLPAPLKLAWDPAVMVRRFRCHRLLVGRFESAFNRIHRNPEAWGTIGDFGGIYLWRPQRGTKSVPSTHGWGISADMDVFDNPQGSAGRVHPHVMTSMEAEGFMWGGRFAGKRRDPMHWEFSSLALLEGGR